MNRRNFVVVLSSAATLPFAVRAQSSAIPAFGSLLAFSSDTGKTFTKPLRAHMEALGYDEGRNIEIDVRYAGGKVKRLPTLAADLVGRQPAVIATFGDATGQAA